MWLLHDEFSWLLGRQPSSWAITEVDGIQWKEIVSTHQRTADFGKYTAECHSSKFLIQFHFNSLLILIKLICMIILIIRESIPSTIHIPASIHSINLNLQIWKIFYGTCLLDKITRLTVSRAKLFRQCETASSTVKRQLSWGIYPSDRDFLLTRCWWCLKKRQR